MWLRALTLCCAAGTSACSDGSADGDFQVGGVGQYEITLGGRGAEEHVVPRNLAVKTGSEVHFVTADNRVHTVEFRLSELAEAQRAFLDATGQGGSPPLIQRGARFVVSFVDAPGGLYPFLVQAHGDPVEGAIAIEP